jgi:tripartite-type tricarboxylate transporter receptor subunit TctC
MTFASICALMKSAEAHMFSRRGLLVCAMLSPALLSARAASWPERSVRLIVPFAPGGNTDSIGRLIGQNLSETLSATFVVENKPGANGAIAAEMVARAAPDGYTLFVAALPQIAIFPAMTKVNYDPAKDFAPISNFGSNPFALIVHPSFPAKTLQEFVAYVRSQPGNLAYASGGVGSLGHLTMVLFLNRAGLDMTHIPYKGGGPAIADVIAGHVPTYFANLSEALTQAKSGSVRVLAVSSAARTPQLPDVATVAESGYPGFHTATWNGLLAPAGTPKPVVDVLSLAVAKAVKDPGVSDKLVALGVDPIGDDPQHFASTISSDISRWSEAIKLAGISLQ